MKPNSQGLRRPHGSTLRESTIMVVIDPVPDDRREAVIVGVQAALSDLRAALADQEAMRGLIDRSVAELEAGAKSVDPALLAESVEFLRWIKPDNFVLLGARSYAYPRNPDGSYAAEAPLAFAASRHRSSRLTFLISALVSRSVGK